MQRAKKGIESVNEMLNKLDASKIRKFFCDIEHKQVDPTQREFMKNEDNCIEYTIRILVAK